MSSVETQEPALASYEESDRHLRRSMTLTQLLFLSLGGIIGSGWLFAALAADSIAGPASVISWLVGGILVLFVAFNYAEIAGMLPRTGALSRYPQLTHGGYTGFLLSWAYLLSAVSVPAIEAEASVTYLSGRFPGLGLTESGANSAILSFPNGILLGFGFLFVFGLLNYLGIKFLAEFNRWIVWWKLIIPTITFILLFFAFKSQNFGHAVGGFVPNGKAPIFEAIATSGIVFSYLGFRQALEFAGEARNPQRDIPRATIYSVVIGIVLYVMLQIAFTGALNWKKAGVHIGNWTLLTKATIASAPFYDELHAAGIGLLAAFASLLVIDAVVSPAGTGWVYLGTSSRTVYGMSIQRFLPKGFQKMNRFRVPWPAIIASVIVGCVFFIPLPSWYKMVGFISSCTVLTYIMGGVGLTVFRKHAPDLPRPYRMPAGKILAPLGFIAAVMIVYWSGFATLSNVFAAVFAGMFIFMWFYAPEQGWFSANTGVTLGTVFIAALVYVNYKGGWVLRSSPPAHGAWNFGAYYFAFLAVVVIGTLATWAVSSEKGREQINHSWWFIVLCFTTYGLSYYGEYGPLPVARIAFPWSDLIEIGIALLIFYWAVYSGYETDELREITTAAKTGVPIQEAVASVLSPKKDGGESATPSPAL
ncbi:MAG: APC family permease [Acidimicrobiales bacterium]